MNKATTRTKNNHDFSRNIVLIIAITIMVATLFLFLPFLNKVFNNRVQPRKPAEQAHVPFQPNAQQTSNQPAAEQANTSQSVGGISSNHDESLSSSSISQQPAEVSPSAGLNSTPPPTPVPVSYKNTAPQTNPGNGQSGAAPPADGSTGAPPANSCLEKFCGSTQQPNPNAPGNQGIPDPPPIIDPPN